MSEEIEELVNNLNTSLTYAIKTTLGPYVQKLNLNNERYKVVTNLLKSLPEYKEMENDILHYRSDNKQLYEKLNDVIAHNNYLQKENEFMRDKLKTMLENYVLKSDNASDSDVVSESTPTDTINTDESTPMVTDTVHTDESTPMVTDTVHTDEITPMVTDTVNNDESNHPTPTPTPANVSDEKINVGLNVIESVNNIATTDIDVKVKEIYSEAKIDCVNKNIVAPVRPELRGEALSTPLALPQTKLVHISDSVLSSSNFKSKTDREKEIEDIVSELEKHLLLEEADEELGHPESSEEEEEEEEDVEEDEEEEEEEEVEKESESKVIEESSSVDDENVKVNEVASEEEVVENSSKNEESVSNKIADEETEVVDEEANEVVQRTNEVVDEEANEVVQRTNEVVQRTNEVVQRTNEVEHEEEVEEEEEEEELFAITIPGFKNEFYTSDEMNGDIYEVNSDDSVGKLLGKFKNGKPVWNK
jgi:hypothetical protein